MCERTSQRLWFWALNFFVRVSLTSDSRSWLLPQPKALVLRTGTRQLLFLQPWNMYLMTWRLTRTLPWRLRVLQYEVAPNHSLHLNQESVLAPNQSQRRSQLYLNWRARSGEWWVKNARTGGARSGDKAVKWSTAKWVQGSGLDCKNESLA